MDKWAIIHDYRRAVASGKVSPIRCPDCNDELYTVVGTDTEPALKCFYCRSVFTPGLDLWEEIKRAIK